MQVLCLTLQSREGTRQLSAPRLLRGSSFMATKVPMMVATAPMQKASSRRPVALMMRLQVCAQCQASYKVKMQQRLSTCLMSAENSSRGTARGSRNLLTAV